MKYKLIINPQSGKSTGALAQILRFFRSHNLPCDVYETTTTGDAIREAKISRNHYDVIISGGGDGTINEIVNGMMGGKAVLGILPIGTANVLALELGIPSTLIGALRKILCHSVRKIDVGNVNGRYFTLCCGIGLDAQIVQDVQLPVIKQLKKLSFVTAALKNALLYDSPELTAKVNNKEFTGKMMIASNARHYAGEYVLGRGTRLDDGQLTVSVFEDVSLIGTVTHMMFGIATGKAAPEIEQIKVQRITVTSPQPVLVHADAEIIGTTPARISVKAKKLSVIA